MKRKDTLNSVWLEFQRNDASNEWLLGVPNAGVIPGGNTFTIDYYDGTTEFPYLQVSNAGAIKFPAYTTAGLLANDTSGNVTTATIGTGLSLSAGVLSATGGGGTPGGSNTQVQFNNSGSFGASSGLTWNGASSLGGLAVDGGIQTGNNPSFRIFDSNVAEPVWMRVEQSNISAAFELGVAGAAGQFLTDAHAGDAIFKGYGTGGPGMAIGGGPTSPSTSLYIKYVSGAKGRVIVGGVADDGTNDLQVLSNAFIKNSVLIGDGTAGGPFLKINSSTYTLLQYARGGTSKFSTGTANAANDFITGTVQDDMAFKSDASKSILFSTDNGSSATLKLVASTGLIQLGSATPEIQFTQGALNANTLNFRTFAANTDTFFGIVPNGTATDCSILLHGNSDPDNSGHNSFGFGGGFAGAIAGSWNFGSFNYASPNSNSRPISFVLSDGSGRYEAMRLNYDRTVWLPNVPLTTGLSIAIATKTFPLTINGTVVNVLCQ